ncbi:MAG: VapC toxin family PIN domain ribonuclease, partial [Synechococcales cyanobacterium RM1_1_8]|nr:VapC toxin family PIN domain ribonuclease [Synechococcales cyanobacterium RM1_1_8]
MSDLFIDTSGWASLFMPTETFHPQAAQSFRQAQQDKSRLVTTKYVVAELVALLDSRQRAPRPQL